MENLLISRRAIYDKKMHAFAYELLFQDVEKTDNGVGWVPDKLTLAYLEELFSQEESKSLWATSHLFVSFSQNMLKEAIPESLPKDKFVVFLNEKNITIDEKVIATIQSIKSAGFQMALQGFTAIPEVKALYTLADYIKIDVTAHDEAEIRGMLVQYPDLPIKWIATQVERHDSLELCKSLGFTYFEGNFLILPNLVTSNKVSTNKLTAMRLLIALDDPDISINNVEELLSQDARLSYKLLRVINSAAFALPRAVNSLREAVIFLGLQQIRSWASLIVLSSVEEKPKDLMLTTMIRAKMCETLADTLGADDPKSYFTVGLFSTLDALLDKSMSDAIADLSISDELKVGLIEHTGEMGDVLSVVIAYEKGEWDKLKDCGLSVEVLRNSYVNSVNWATHSFGELR